MAVAYRQDISYVVFGIVFWGNVYRIELVSKALMTDAILYKQLCVCFNVSVEVLFPMLSFVGHTGGSSAGTFMAEGEPRGNGWILAGTLGCAVVWGNC